MYGRLIALWLACASGESVSFDYAGRALFGMRLAAGAYELRFRVGELTSEWARFEIAP